MPYIIDDFPRQKVSLKSKNKAWAKKCCQAAAQLLLNNDQSLRKSLKNKLANYNLRINEIDVTDVQKTCDPHQLYGDTFPDTFKHIGRGNAYLNLLIGEKLKRNNDFKVYLSSKDQDGISLKEKDLQKELVGQVTNSIMKGYKNPEEAKGELEKMKSYMQYDYQDIRETTANKMLKREYQRQNLKGVFAECFEDALVCGEEVVCIEVVSRDLKVRKVNPLQFYTIGNGYSEKVEDSDIIVEYEYLSVGQIIDRYYEELSETPGKIDELEKGYSGNKGNTGNPYKNIDFIPESYAGNDFSRIQILGPQGARYHGRFKDANGNVLVTHVNWRSRKKIGELTYFNPDDGSEEQTIVPEGYEADPTLGESIKWMWVNEWYKATLIGEEDLVDWGPIPFQGRSLHQLSVGKPNYVGLYYNTNQGGVHSLMDVIKPLDYSYDIAYWKRDQHIAKHFGSTTFYNLSMVPAGWDPEKWLQYALQKGLAPLDPTNEILKGQNQGKSAGIFNQFFANNVQSGAAGDIKLYTEILMSLEDQMSKVSGITPQREAQVQASETATGSQLAYQQSAAITENLFFKQSSFEQRALSLLLEKAKYLYSKYPQAGQYVFDEVGIQMIKSYDEFDERMYDVYVSNSGKEAKLYQSLEQLAHAAMQNGQATFADVMSIYLSDSTQHLTKRLQQSSERIAKQQEEQTAKQIEAASQEAERQREFDKWKAEREYEIRKEELVLKQMEFDDKAQDTNRNWIKDEVEMDMALLEQEGKDKDRTSAEKLKREDMRSKEKIAKMKPKPTSK